MFRQSLLSLLTVTSLLATLALAQESKSKGASNRAPADVPVLAAKAEKQTVPLRISTTGFVQAFSTVDIKSQVNAQVMQARFTEGDFVRKGDVLFELDSRSYEALLGVAEANLARDQASAENARRQLSRVQDLRKTEFASTEDEETAQAASREKEAAVLASKAAVEYAKVQLAYCTITSPVDGETGALQIHPGSLAGAANSGPMVTIRQVEPVYVVFNVPETFLPTIRRRKAAGEKMVVRASVAQSGEESAEGELSFIDNSVDTETGTIQLKATFPNTDHGLWPGQFVQVTLILEEQPDRVVVPSEAVQPSQSGSYVYIIEKDSTVLNRPVKVDRVQDGIAVIAEGLNAGDEVVTDGHLRLAPGSHVSIKPALDPKASTSEAPKS